MSIEEGRNAACRSSMAAATAPCADTVSGTVGAPDLCVVVPVLNERDNVAPLIERLRIALQGIAFEIVFVDDGSSDGTREAVAAIGRADARVRLIWRHTRRGLASAFVEGVQSSLAPFVAAIDGDLQHDETVLPAMLAMLQAGDAEVVVGSRYAAGGSLGDWDRRRAGWSGLATWLSRIALRAAITDPMSGLFMLPRAVFDRALPRLSAIGFKILLDLLASLPEPPRVRELPYRFRARIAGQSKLDAGVLFDFALLLLDKLIGAWVPVQFVVFATIGLIGLVAHLIVLRLCLTAAGLSFETAQGVATAGAIVGNFWLNNTLTFRTNRLRGRRLVWGMIIFAAVCSVGMLANLSIAALMVDTGRSSWWRAGVAGAAMSLVWNYAVGSTLTWRRRGG